MPSSHANSESTGIAQEQNKEGSPCLGVSPDGQGVLSRTTITQTLAKCTCQHA